MSKTFNEYAGALGRLYARTPKAVFAAVAVSALTTGGDFIQYAEPRLIREWWALYQAGIVPQRPPHPDPGLDTHDVRQLELALGP